MRYAPRQFVHMLGIAMALVLMVWLFDQWHQEKLNAKPVNLQQYTWLASMNMREANKISKPLIKSGAVAMLLAQRSQRDVVNLKYKAGVLPGTAGEPIPLFRFDSNGNHLIDATDPLFHQLFLASYHDGQMVVRPIAKTHIRAIVVHHQGQQVRYHAILSGGVQWFMQSAPQSRPYNPLLEH